MFGQNTLWSEKNFVGVTQFKQSIVTFLKLRLEILIKFSR